MKSRRCAKPTIELVQTGPTHGLVCRTPYFSSSSPWFWVLGFAASVYFLSVETVFCISFNCGNLAFISAIMPLRLNCKVCHLGYFAIMAFWHLWLLFCHYGKIATIPAILPFILRLNCKVCHLGYFAIMAFWHLWLLFCHYGKIATIHAILPFIFNYQNVPFLLFCQCGILAVTCAILPF